MALLMTGATVSQAICARARAGVELLKEQGIVPSVAIVRVGERPEDMAYERGFTKRAQSLDIEVRKLLLPEDVCEEELIRTLQRVNEAPDIHGCLLFRPLPDRLSTPAVLGTLRPEKDIDAMTSTSMGALMTHSVASFPPCTATACLEILHHYEVPLMGKNVVMVGSSMTVGMPTAILLVEQGATVSVCNIFTDRQRMAQLCRDADIIISAAGKAGLIDKNHISPGQIIVDVGINPGPDGKIRGDVDFEQAEPVVAAITPVPGGVGAVTPAVLAAHTVEAALRSCGLTLNKRKANN